MRRISSFVVLFGLSFQVACATDPSEAPSGAGGGASAGAAGSAASIGGSSGTGGSAAGAPGVAGGSGSAGSTAGSSGAGSSGAGGIGGSGGAGGIGGSGGASGAGGGMAGSGAGGSAGAGGAAGNGGAAGGGCGDIKTDSHNCGECGHDCLGGACTDGMCPDIVLAATEDAPQYIAVNGTQIFWSSNDKVIRTCDKDSCAGGPTNFAKSPGSGGIVATDTTVFWGDNVTGLVSSCPAAGCTTETLLAASNTVAGVAIENDILYFAAYADGTNGYIASCPLTGCPGMAPQIVTKNVGAPLTIAVRGGVAYVGDRDHNHMWSCPVTGCGNQPTSFYEGKGADGVAVDDTHVYMTTQVAGQAVSCPITGCAGTPKVLADKKGAPSGIVESGDFVYIAENVDQAWLLRCHKDGSGCITLAKGQKNELYLAVDDKYVYWTDVGSFTPMFINKDGSVHKTAK